MPDTFPQMRKNWVDILGDEHIDELLISRSVTEAEILNYKPNVIGEASIFNIDGKGKYRRMDSG